MGSEMCIRDRYSQPSCPGGPVVGTDRWDAAGSGRPACPPALWRPLTPAGRAQVAPHSLRTHSRMVLSAAGARRRSRRRSSEPPHSRGPLMPSASKYHSKKIRRRSPPPRYHSPRGTPTLPAKVQGGVVGGDHKVPPCKVPWQGTFRRSHLPRSKSVGQHHGSFRVELLVSNTKAILV